MFRENAHPLGPYPKEAKKDIKIKKRRKKKGENGLLNKKNVRALLKSHGKQIGGVAMNALEKMIKVRIEMICSTMGGYIKRISLSDILSLQNINKTRKRLVKRSVL